MRHKWRLVGIYAIGAVMLGSSLDGDIPLALRTALLSIGVFAVALFVTLIYNEGISDGD